jgi:hypothetical protein
MALGCILVGAVLGMWLQRILPDHHLSDNANDFVRLGTGLVGSIAVLVLGLLIASAKNTFDTKSAQVNSLIADIIVMDNMLAQFGSEATATRQELRRVSDEMVDRIWIDDASDFAETKPFEVTSPYDPLICPAGSSPAWLSHTKTCRRAARISRPKSSS